MKICIHESCDKVVPYLAEEDGENCCSDDCALKVVEAAYIIAQITDPNFVRNIELEEIFDAYNKLHGR
jgi:hypothetical protein